MEQSTPNEIIIAHCGLCCTNCGMLIKGKCEGCHSDKPMNRNCEMKACAIERGFSTCASCKDFADYKQCKKLNTLVSFFFGFIFHTNRIGNLKRIKEIGLDNFKREKIGDKKP